MRVTACNRVCGSDSKCCKRRAKGKRALHSGETQKRKGIGNRAGREKRQRFMKERVATFGDELGGDGDRALLGSR